MPILAEIPLAKKKGEGAIVVRENKNDIMEETFRGLRTNLLFMLGKDERVVMFSSTQPGEGKSFVAGNTAVSLEMCIRDRYLNSPLPPTKRGIRGR